MIVFIFQVPDLKINQNQIASTNNNTQIVNHNSNQLPPMKIDEINKVLDDVNVMKSKQKQVDDSLFAVKK